MKMHQLTFFDEDQGKRLPKAIVNVASVPHRSPFRYPGGKTWLVPYIRQWLNPAVRESLELFPISPRHLVEPFAGGGVVSLTAVMEHFVEHITMVEKDEEVAAVWQTVLDHVNCSWLANEIVAFEVTQHSVVEYIKRTDLGLKERAFRTILRNRMNRGGILAPGAGLLKSGENGKGLRSRWYPQTLSKRILTITELRDQIHFILGDGLAILQSYVADHETVFFLDPPYTAGGKNAGKRLYTHSEINHIELFEIANTLHGNFLMTYDDSKEVRQLAKQFHFDIEAIPMKNSHHAQMTELLISTNLDWVRQMLHR